MLLVSFIRGKFGFNAEIQISFWDCVDQKYSNDDIYLLGLMLFQTYIYYSAPQERSRGRRHREAKKGEQVGLNRVNKSAILTNRSARTGKEINWLLASTKLVKQFAG